MKKKKSNPPHPASQEWQRRKPTAGRVAHRAPTEATFPLLRQPHHLRTAEENEVKRALAERAERGIEWSRECEPTVVVAGVPQRRCEGGRGLGGGMYRKISVLSQGEKI